MFCKVKEGKVLTRQNQNAIKKEQADLRKEKNFSRNENHSLWPYHPEHAQSRLEMKTILIEIIN